MKKPGLGAALEKLACHSAKAASMALWSSNPIRQPHPWAKRSSEEERRRWLTQGVGLAPAGPDGQDSSVALQLFFSGLVLRRAFLREALQQVGPGNRGKAPGRGREAQIQDLSDTQPVLSS